jgi:Tol biopolymer transport system component
MLERFEREAKAVAALAHPNILAIYDFGTADGRVYAAMELLEGTSLREQLAGGPLPPRKAMTFARQAAEALGAAHARGIVHRDIKPDNLFITSEGQLKVLDFGLATERRGAGADSNTSAPTATPLTNKGTVMGTVGYMAPEQVRGEEADERSDIFALGCVLHEMLTGQRAFARATTPETMTAILREEPADLTMPSGPVPPALERVVRRCLEKNPAERFLSARDLGFAIENSTTASGEAVSPPTSGGRQRPPTRATVWIAGLVLVAVTAALTLAIVFFSSPRDTSEQASMVRRFVIPLPDGGEFRSWVPVDLAISPDGRRIVFDAVVDSTRRLYVRELDSLQVEALRGTDGAELPFFSPDGSRVGFVAENQLMHVGFDGGSPISVGDFRPGGGLWWGEDGMIVANQGWDPGMVQVPASGGTPRPLTESTEGDGYYLFPQVLPGGERVLFTEFRSSLADIGVSVIDRSTGEIRRLLPRASFARLLPGGRLFYAEGGRLMVVRVDPENLQPQGAAVPVLDDLQQNPEQGAAPYAISANGTLVYRPGGLWDVRRQMVWVDRRGEATPLGVPPAAIEDVAVSPDGDRLALAVFDQGLVGLHVHELATGTTAQVTFDNFDSYPVWGPDGLELAFTSSRLGPWDVFRAPVDRSREPEAVLTRPTDQVAMDWSPDGRSILYKDNYASLERIALEEGTISGGPEVTQVGSASYSPDGRWIAYSTNESGVQQLRLARVGETGSRLLAGGGSDLPAWSDDGEELFFTSGRTMNVVAFRRDGNDLVPGRPRVLFERSFHRSEVGGWDYDSRRDRFVMIEPGNGEMREGSFVVVSDWFAEVDRILAASE